MIRNNSISGDHRGHGEGPTLCFKDLPFVGRQALRSPAVFAGFVGSSEVAAKEEPVFGNDLPAL